MAARDKAAAYHGVQNMKFATRTGDAYATGDKILPLLYAQSINPSALLEAAEQYADNRLLFRVPNDKGYEGEIGTTAPDPELEKAAGYVLEGANGLIGADVINYVRGALYYEFIERDKFGKARTVKTWMFNVEVGKGSATHSTDKNSVEFGSYTYPVRMYGDPVMTSAGTEEYVDADGMKRTAFMLTCRPGDTGYATFAAAVPVPKLATVPGA